MRFRRLAIVRAAARSGKAREATIPDFAHSLERIGVAYSASRLKGSGRIASYGRAVGVAEFIADVAWPVVVLVIALLYRATIVDLLGRARDVRAGPFGITLEQVLAESDRFDEPDRHRRAASAAGALESELTSLRDLPPSALVLAVYDVVEGAVRERVRPVVHPDELGKLEGARLLDMLRRHELVDENTLRAVKGVRVLRNLVAHGREPTAQEASDYIALADAVLYALNAPPRPQADAATWSTD